MEIAYVSGPYRSPRGMSGVYENIDRARQVAMALWEQGYAVICPHMNTAYMDGVVSDSKFLNGDLEIVKRCDIIVMMPFWRLSEGARVEKAVAEQCGLAVFEWPKDANALDTRAHQWAAVICPTA